MKFSRRMLLLFFVGVLILMGCKSSEDLCPEPKKVKARRVTMPKSAPKPETITASNQQLDREKSLQKMREQQIEARAAKTPEAAEEWDCPKPGSKAQSRFAKENIRKNKKKIREYFKNRVEADSVATAGAAGGHK